MDIQCCESNTLSVLLKKKNRLRGKIIGLNLLTRCQIRYQVIGILIVLTKYINLFLPPGFNNKIIYNLMLKSFKIFIFISSTPTD